MNWYFKVEPLYDFVTVPIASVKIWILQVGLSFHQSNWPP